MKFDMHLHTTQHSPDSIMRPAELVQRVRDIGLNGVVITEHDWLWTEEELEQLRKTAPELVILAGVEVSTLEGHFLAYGITDPFRLTPGIGVAKLCREVHRQGGVVVAAHPFRWGQPFGEILREQQPELDGLEMMSSNMDQGCRRLAAELVASPQVGPLAQLGNSDAHEAATLGVCYTEFETVVRTNAELVEAIRSRRCRPHAAA